MEISIIPILVLSFIAYMIYSDKSKTEAKHAPDNKMRKTFGMLKDIVSESYPITTPYNNYFKSHFTKSNKSHIIEVSGNERTTLYEPFIRFQWIVKENKAEIINITERFDTDSSSAYEIWEFMKEKTENL